MILFILNCVILINQNFVVIVHMMVLALVNLKLKYFDFLLKLLKFNINGILFVILAILLYLLT